MATPEGNTRSFAAQDRTGHPLSLKLEKRCNHCRRPIEKQVVADRKPYCGRLCAALGLIATVDRIGEIDDACGIDAVLQLVESVFYEGPPSYRLRCAGEMPRTRGDARLSRTRKERTRFWSASTTTARLIGPLIRSWMRNRRTLTMRWIRYCGLDLRSAEKRLHNERESRRPLRPSVHLEVRGMRKAPI